MYPSTWRCGGGTNVNTSQGCLERVTVRTKKELPEVISPACDVASNQVRVVFFECVRAPGGPRQDTVAKSGGKPFDLTFDTFAHIEPRPVWNMTIGPSRMSSCRCTREIKYRG